MPKAVLEFNLPEENMEFKEAVNGGKYLMVLQDLDNFLRSECKYNDSLSEDTHNAYDLVRDKIRSICEDAGVALFE